MSESKDRAALRDIHEVTSYACNNPANTTGQYQKLIRVIRDRCNVRLLHAQPDPAEQLAEALQENAHEDLQDVRLLASRVLEGNHKVTGTEAERIAYLLRKMDRDQRVARAALAAYEASKQ